MCLYFLRKKRYNTTNTTISQGDFMINSYTKMKLKQKVYTNANMLTWNLSLFIVTAIILLNNRDVPILYVFPAIFASVIILTFFSQSVAKFFLNVMYGLFILMIAAFVFQQPFDIDSSGILSSIWFGIVLSNTFLVLTMGYFVKNTYNKFFIAFITTVINVAVVLVFGYGQTIMSGMDNNEITALLIKDIFAIFIIVAILTGLLFFFNNKSYALSMKKNKVLSKAHTTLKKEKTPHIKDMEKTFVEEVFENTERTGFMFKVFNASNRKQGYIYKDNKTFVLLPVEITAQLNFNNANIFKGSGVRRKTFNKILYSFVNKYSAIGSIPSVPIVFTLVVMGENENLQKAFTYELKTPTETLHLNIVPLNNFKQWLNDVDNETTERDILFPELSDKAKKSRDENKVLAQVNKDYIENM